MRSHLRKDRRRPSSGAVKVLLTACCCLLLPACNVLRGVGQDMAAVGRTLARVSGTDTSHTSEDTGPVAQPFDPSYEDQSYLEPAEPMP